MDENIFQRLTMQCRNILRKAERIADVSHCNTIDISHIAYALLDQRNAIPDSLLQKLGQDRIACLARLYKLCMSQGDATLGSAVIGFSDGAQHLLEVACAEADAHRDYGIWAGCILLALFSVGRDEAQVAFDTTVLALDRIAEIFRGVVQDLNPTHRIPPPYDPEAAFPQRIMTSPNWGGEADKYADTITELKKGTHGLLGAHLIATVRKVTEAHSLSYSLRVVAANIMCDAHEYDEALFHLGIAISICPHEPIAYRRMARVASLNNHIELARRILRVGWEQYLSYVDSQHIEEDRTWWFSESFG
jgi:hypothetical protein